MEASVNRGPSDAKTVAWQVVLAVGAGAIVGALIGGVGGRLAMLILRLGSDDVVRGVATDDGFEIGRFTTSTFFLLQVTAGLGGATGLAFLVLRSALPARGRPLIWGVAAALIGGANLVNPDTLDFTILDPKSFAVASFVLLPGLAAFVIALVVERLLVVEPWSSRRLASVVGVGCLPLVPVFPVVAIAGGGMLVVRRRPRLGEALGRVGRVAVPLVLAGLAVKGGVELWSDSRDILG